MKKLFVKLFAVGMALAVSLTAFSACGKKSDTIKIGCSGPLTGGAAIYGIAVKNAADLAVKEINDNGGVNGLKLEFIMKDDEHNATKASSAYDGLMDEKIQLSLGTVTSAPMNAMKAKAKYDNIFVLTPSATSKDCIEYDNAFRVCFSDPDQGDVAAKYINDNFTDVTKVAILYDSSDAYSTGIKDNFKAAANSTTNNYRFSVTTEQAIETGTSYSAQLNAAKECDLILLPIYYEKAAAIIKYAKTEMSGFENKIFFGCDGLDGIEAQFAENEKSLLNGVKYMSSFDATAEANQTFVNAFKAAYNNTIPNQFAANTYDAIYIFKALLEKCEVKNASINCSDLCNKFKSAIVSDFSFSGVTGTNVKWTADGEPSKLPTVISYSFN